MASKRSSVPLLSGFLVAAIAAGAVGIILAQAPASAPQSRGGAQNTKPEDVAAMMAALPDKAPAKPARPRKVLVLCAARGYVHPSTPLAAKTVEALGTKTGAWSTAISCDSAVITAEYLKAYDLLFLDNTTGDFLDDPNNQAVTGARRKALLDFVRGGKGLAGIHAATDSYHTIGHGPPVAAKPASAGPALQVGTWPEFNLLIGGFFKFHWVYPQLITVKIDDPGSPLTKMFHGREFEIHDETYTFAQNSFSRRRVHVLTSIDYGKMSAADKALETDRRTDGDYALSYIRHEGKGRVFYEAHGHSETIYAMKPMLEHILAGIQYAIGDLKADDNPSVKPAK